MTKRDLVERISLETGFIQKDVTIVIQKLLDALADEIAAGHTVELRNFGVFDVVTSQSRTGRNPNHPEKKVIIPSRAGLKFSYGKALKARTLQADTDGR